LIKNRGSSVVKIVISKWTDKGSKSLFEEFIARNVSPWVSYLTNSSNHFKVDVVVGDSYLGCGAFGRVFKVNQGVDTFALKVVEEKNASRLECEQRAMTLAAHTGLTAIISGTLIKPTGSAALLLSPVGAPMPYPKNEEEVKRLFLHLWMLHERNLTHEDPRVWIDLFGVGKTCVTMKRDDVRILTKSILRISGNAELEETIEALIAKYVEVQTQESIECLVQEVSKHLQKKLQTHKRCRHPISNVDTMNIDSEQA
jgi:hypothetical protein